MKIFLDVGVHIGQTLDEVLQSYHKFDKIYAFEPSSLCFKILSEKYKNEKLILNNFGLSNISGEVNLYDTGTAGASIYQDKCDLIDKTHFEKVRLVEASHWIIENTSPTDDIYLKLNCEGSECDIIENLINTGVYDKISHIMIDFDVRKIPSQIHRQGEIMMMVYGKTNIHTCDSVMIGKTHQDRIRNWLSICTR